MWGTAFLNADLELFGGDVLAPIIFRAETFGPRYVLGCNILPPKNKNFPLLYETRAIFSHEHCCRKFGYRRLTCT